MLAGPRTPASRTHRFAGLYAKLWQYGCNAALASCYLLFSWCMLTDFVLTHRVSSLMLTVFETLIVFYSLCRPAPKQTNTSLYDWTVALTGTFILLLMRPAPLVHDHAAILILQLMGMSISLFALLSLNKSWGLVAANRGVKTGGLYGFVRHPIYAGYFISFATYLAQNATVANAVIYLLFACLAVLRIGAEERLLLRDQAYVSYSQNTRWRVLPFVY